jgi:hypothetical protein
MGRVFGGSVRWKDPQEFRPGRLVERGWSPILLTRLLHLMLLCLCSAPSAPRLFPLYTSDPRNAHCETESYVDNEGEEGKGTR